MAKVQGIDRRRFVKASGLSALAVGTAVAGAPIVSTIRRTLARRRYAASELRAEILTPLEGETVDVVSPSGGAQMRVEDVTEQSLLMDDRGNAVGTEFLVTLTGDSSNQLDQGTYEFRSDRIGEFPLFIVPTDMVESGRQNYQAVFSRLA